MSWKQHAIWWVLSDFSYSIWEDHSSLKPSKWRFDLNWLEAPKFWSSQLLISWMGVDGSGKHTIRGWETWDPHSILPPWEYERMWQRWFDWFYFKIFTFKYSIKFLAYVGIRTFFVKWSHMTGLTSGGLWLFTAQCSLVIMLAFNWLSNVVMTGDPDSPEGSGTSWGGILTSSSSPVPSSSLMIQSWKGMPRTMTWIRCHRWGGALSTPSHFCQV